MDEEDPRENLLPPSAMQAAGWGFATQATQWSVPIPGDRGTAFLGES